MASCRLRACLKKVASAILADVEPWLPARRNGVATGQTTVKSERFALHAVFPGGKMPPSTAGRRPAATFSDRLSVLVLAKPLRVIDPRSGRYSIKARDIM